MGKAKWWVCEDCTSLNDIPANKCYKCRVSKPGDPKLIDDQYSQVGGGDQRVGITVDLANVGDLTRPDPLETAQSGTVMEAFEKTEDPYSDIDRTEPGPASTPRYDPYSGGPETPGQQAEPRPLREPAKRGIDALGGMGWTEGLGPLTESADAGVAASAGGPAVPPDAPPGAPPRPPAPPPPSSVPRPPGTPPPPPPPGAPRPPPERPEGE